MIGLQDRTFAHTLRWLLVAAALLAAWIWRRAPGSRRAIAVVVGLAVPIGLSGLVPAGLDAAAGRTAAGCAGGRRPVAPPENRRGDQDVACVGPAAAIAAIGISFC